MKSLRTLALLTTTLLLLTVAPSLVGQDGTPSEPRDIVLQAVENLAEGYAYTLEVTIEQHFIGDEAGDNIDIYTTHAIIGDVAANGDYHLDITIHAGETADFAELQSFEMAHVRVADDLFLNLADIEEAFGDILEDVDSGWHNLDDLLETVAGDLAQEIVIQNLGNAPRPTEFPLTDALIVSVTEEASTTMDDVDMRVFEVEVDALQVMLEQMPGDTLDTVRMLLDNVSFVNKSDLSLHYTLWIGAEDGLLYRGESAGRNFLPYLTEDVSPGPPYDLDISSTATFTISQHGAVGEITLPEAIQ